MRFAALLALAAAAAGSVAAGCAAATQDARVALTVQGAAAGPGEQVRCRDAAAKAGAVVDGTAPVKAIVTLEPAGARLQVLSPSRGLVRDETRPAGNVETLCRDAALAAVAAAGATSAAAPTYDSPASLAGPEPVSSPSTSGGAYRGPISP